MPNTSPGPDSIPAQIIKNISPDNVSHFLNICNCSWHSDEVALEWKESTAIAIGKKDNDFTEGRFYRPIALTSDTVNFLNA